MFVKVCGLTRPDDAHACIELGVDAVGFNRWASSKRYVGEATLRELATAARGRCERFGVYVDADPGEVEAALSSGLIDVAQLHGDEPPSVVTDLEARFPGRVVKALRLGAASDVALLDGYLCARFLIDAPSPGYGGSGRLLDEELARSAIVRATQRSARVLLAGGLDADNVEAVARRLQPHGVDVASGVETAPGLKDPDRLRRFVAAARRAAQPGP